MDLAEQLIQASNSNFENTDELGLPTADTVDYLVARAIYRNALAKEKDDRIGLLHKRDGVIFLGKSPIAETADNAYRLVLPRKSIRKYEVSIFWERLREVLPEESKKKIIVSEHLLWNIETGELEYYKENLLRRAI